MFATLPLSYCTNVHPGLTAAEVAAGLAKYTQPLAERTGGVAAGLWLADPVTQELIGPDAAADAVDRFRESLGPLPVYTLNAFPQGNFHSEVVKEAVYRPTWADRDRLDYTLRCASLLARLMPDGVQGSISTVPLAAKSNPATAAADFESRAIANLLECACALDDLHDETGRVIRLAIEPEPRCLLETTNETVAFFESLFAAADREGCEAIARDHLGVCYDVCHQAVEFEDVVKSIGQLRDAEIRINKVHLSCAIELADPASTEQRQALAAYVEPRYLHQTFAQTADRRVVFRDDLTAELCESPPEEFAAARRWRVHFHVPVHATRLGPLRTTRPELSRALAAVKALPYAPHLEVETYTWGVLPGEQVDLIDGLTQEIEATKRLLAQLELAAMPG